MNRPRPARPPRPDRRALVAALVLAAFAGPVAAADPAADAATDPALAAALRAPGTVVLMRHALAPGVGDPPGFRPGDCTTQRNLSDEGRAQARAAGARLRALGVVVGQVQSSPWCRCLETARLLGVGEVRPSEAFASSFREDDRREAEIAAQARRVIADWRGPGVLVAVTHQVNIQAITGENTASGEMLVLARGADGRHALVGRLR